MEDYELELARQIAVNSGDIQDTIERLIDEVHRLREQRESDPGTETLTGTQYHELAMRTAAGPEVFYYPEDGHTASIGGLTMTRYDIDDRFFEDLRDFLEAAARLDDWKSVLFYGKSKYARCPVPVGEDPAHPEFPTFDQLFEGEISLDFIRNPQLLHAILGIASEAGEIAVDLAELCKASNYEGPLSLANMNRESGDIDWFQELLAHAVGQSVDQNRIENVERLRKRFPGKFSAEDAVARKDEE